MDKDSILVEAKEPFQEKVESALSSVKEELDDHLSAINENSSEIHANFEYLQMLDNKIDKLKDRIDEIHLLVKGSKSQNKDNFTFKALTNREKEIFAALYSLTETSAFATYEQIAQKTTLTSDLVLSYVGNLVAKGIPINKKYFQKVAYVSLDHDFRQLQAKDNIVRLNTQLTSWIKNS